MKPGLHEGLSNEAYHAGLGDVRALSSTFAKTLLFESPAEAMHQATTPKDTDTFAFGRLVHELTLEREVKTFADTGLSSRRGNAWAEACEAAEASGRTPITSRQMSDAQAIAAAVHGHPIAGDLLSVGRAEVSALAHDPDHGINVQARFDWLRDPEGEHPVIVDLKTTAGTANPRNFNRTIGTFRYHLQGAFYRRVYRLITGRQATFVWVVVSKEPPHTVSVIRLSEVDAATGDLLVARASDIYADCLAADNWPGYDSIYSSALPTWADYEAQEVTA